MTYPGSEAENDLIIVSNQQFDIKKFIFKLLSYAPWIALSLIIAYSVGKLYLRYTPVVHRVSANILIKDDEESSSDYKILRELGVMPGSREVQNQIDILESYGLMRSIVDSLNLQLNISTEGRISSTSLYGDKRPVNIRIINKNSVQTTGSYKMHVFPDKIALGEKKNSHYYNYGDTVLLNGYRLLFEKNNIKVKHEEAFRLSFLDAKGVAMSLRSGIDVRKLHEMGGVIQIAMLDQNPQRAADIINTLLQTYNTAGVRDKNVVGLKTVQFLNERIDTVAHELNLIELASDKFKSQNRTGDNLSGIETQYLAQATSYDNQGIEQNGQIALLQSLEQFIKTAGNFTDIIPSGNSLSEPTLLKLIDQYNTTVLDYQTQLQISTEKDPSVARIRTDLTELKGNILKNIQSIRAGYTTRLQQLQATKNNFENLLAGVPAKERELLNMKRQISVKEQLYLYLLQKREETQLSLSSNINNTRIVDEAFDIGVASPNSSQVMMISISIGLLAPVTAILLIGFFNNKIIDRNTIEEGTKAPVVGELSFDKQSYPFIVHARSREMIAEQLRLVRTNINYMNGDKSIKTILVTSFMSGEGKSFVSLNLAASIAGSETKVLLLELDLRKPKFAKYLGIEAQYGLTDVIAGNIPFQKAVVQSSQLSNTDIVTCGPIPPNPAEMMGSNKLKLLIEEVQDAYDYIIMDTSPIGLVADGFLLAHLSDLCLFIIRQKYSYKTTIKYIDTLYRQRKFKQMGVVVNGITDMKSFSYGYGYSYGYYNGIGYYENGGGRNKNRFITRMFSKS